MTENKYYVYVYIDPRTNKDFYYGKGKDDRKFAHLGEKFDSDKNQLIQEIRKAGYEPLIKVVAKDLTEEQALFIESTLLWKSGDEVTNKVAGNFSEHFRKPNTLHLDLPNFDYENGIYCLNVGEGPYRSWEDCDQYGFISAGQSWDRWGSRIAALKKDDIVCAYLSRYGYVGVGVVEQEAKSVLDFTVDGKYLKDLPLRQKEIYLDEKAGTREGEYLIKVRWLETKPRKSAVAKSKKFWRARSMLGSLENQPETKLILEKEFKVSFEDLLKMRISKKAA